MATPKNLTSFCLLCLFCMLAATMSCSKKTNSLAGAGTAVAVFATVVDYTDLDGCTYILELSDGQKLQPVNLPEDFKRKGLKLFITWKFHDGVSTCMAGRMVTLTSVTIAKEDNR